MRNKDSLLPAARQQRILEILREEFTVRSSHLSELLSVSEMSIAPFKHIDVLITNRKIPKDFEKDLESMGVQVVIG